MKSGRRKATRKCEYCGERLVRTEVNVYRHRGKRHVLFRDVPAFVCRSCGARVFEAPAFVSMDFQLKHPLKKKRTVELEIRSV